METVTKSNLHKLVTITEYADLCGLNRNSIHVRINNEKNPQPYVEADPDQVLKFIQEKGLEAELRETRSKYYKAVVQASAKQRGLILIDKVKYPPKRRKTGRGIVKKTHVGAAVKSAMAEAGKQGYTMLAKTHGYKLTSKADGSHNDFQNLPEVYQFLGASE